MQQKDDFFDCPPFTVIVVAAGSGVRLGSEIPKQYLTVAGQSVLAHSLSVFLTHPACRAVLTVIADGAENLYRKAVASAAANPKLLPPVVGGSSRQESVANALKALPSYEREGEADEALILVHDAARPCLSHAALNRLLRLMRTERAASLALPVSDTLRKGTEADGFGETVSRDGLYAMQTPQAFRIGLLKEAHRRFAGQSGFTDDTSLVSAMNVRVAMVEGEKTNLKITHAEDLSLAELYLAGHRTMMIPRTGLGFDVHAFGDPAETVRIGGVDIPHTHKLKGHSDADVLFHALTDALYGVIADGDIGSHFPPSNPDFKGKDSAFFLTDAVNAVRKQGGNIVHADTVVMCEAPKIGPHREAIQKRVAEIMGIAPFRVSIKATTTEQLGFTGRREGIAAQAIVTVLFAEEGDDECAR